MEKLKIGYLQVTLLAWFSENGRKFFWRNERASTYEVIIAEILLQRTKAGTVERYLPSFLNQYPSWAAMGKASEKQLSLALRPFGLNNLKAKRLYQLNREIKKFDGNLPPTRDMVEELSLFGQYTANAFELFVLRRPSALLDVNMARVLERFFEPRRVKDYRFDKQLIKTASEVVEHTRSKEINWAILDYAALVCKSKQPKCDICKLSKLCTYFKQTHTH